MSIERPNKEHASFYLLLFISLMMVILQNVSTTNVIEFEDSLTRRKLSRERRNLVYTTNPLLQMTIGFTTPYNIPNRPMQISHGFQLNFRLPHNITELRPELGRRRRDVSMVSPFHELERFLEERGFEGQECVLRSICELAESPVDRGGVAEGVAEGEAEEEGEGDDEGILEEILHAILTPSISLDGDRHWSRPLTYEAYDEERYLQAELVGQSGANCTAIYRHCDQSPLDMFTNKYNV